ncbi:MULTISPECIES: glucosaminidase domain-containing protein [Enterococcus]|uniref:glucosaminidase domain-containing protein n=1 Tax=Enterococcus TaxID=1350 RepID=UPI00065DEF66|nr:MULTISPECIES: glucosaminidase domain-containing protein [Enterococcus]KAF1301183.1 N-acetylmuramoyl-L-alanine amidase [Enterococcus sp. JM9B]
MNQYQTRSQRHQAKTAITFKINKKSIATVVGTGLLVTPSVLALNPATASAAEYQTTNDVNTFIEQIGWSAAEVASANDLYASVMIAQALLESGNGTSMLGSAPYYNLFGVKGSYNGQSVYLPTQEYLNGQWVTMNEPFRQYNSYWESFQDHANVLRSTSFSTGTAHYSGTWKSNTSSYMDATAYLTGRYATDPGYNQKLNWLIQAYNLTRFDTPSNGAPSATTETQTTETAQTTTASASTSTGTYTVASGDTLWDIASSYGLTVDQLMSMNGLTSDVIMVGQQLSV